MASVSRGEKFCYLNYWQLSNHIESHIAETEFINFNQWEAIGQEAKVYPILLPSLSLVLISFYVSLNQDVLRSLIIKSGKYDENKNRSGKKIYVNIHTQICTQVHTSVQLSLSVDLVEIEFKHSFWRKCVCLGARGGRQSWACGLTCFMQVRSFHV